jgi:integrase
MHLTQFAIANAVAMDKPIKLSDGEGLHLLVQPNGRKQWRFRYRFAGRENMLAFGSFPTVSLAQARAKREEARKLLADGTDPAAKRKLDRIAAEVAARNTFGDIAAEYVNNLVANGAAESTISKNRWLLQDLATPLAKRPISEILPAEILLILKRIEKSGRRETAQRLRGVLGTVFRYAIVTLRAASDPTLALRGALLKPLVKHRAAITDERELGALMAAIDEYDGWPTLRSAIQLLALTMTRPGDVRNMRRSEINFEKALWRIPAERMKMRRPHDVPLSRQTLEILRDIWPLSENSELVLPSIRSLNKPLSENAMNSALRRMGYSQEEMTAHGFRSSASTILNERGVNPDVIEAALAHQDEDDVRRAYNRATYWPERVKLMQEWADILENLTHHVTETSAIGMIKPETLPAQM